MKAILLTLLFAAVLCDEIHYMRYQGGNFIVNNQPIVKVDGPLEVQFLTTMNITVSAGMHIKSGVKTPFAFAGKIVKFKQDGDKIEIEAKCVEGYWGLKTLANMKGDIRISGTFQKAEYSGNCYHEQTKQNFTLTALGNYAKCPIYPPPEAAIHARLMVGEKAEAYQPINVINFAVLGYPYIDTIPNCGFWLEHFTNETAPKPGYVIVGKDGAHCGIVDKEGDKFIHSNPAKKLVTETPLSLVSNFFRNGYVYKDYNC